MEFSKVNIQRFYKNTKIINDELFIKMNSDDFVVKEIDKNNNILTESPIVNIEKMLHAKQLLDNIPDNLDKAERKLFYDKIGHFPFVKLTTSDGKLTVFEDSTDFFVFTLKKINLSTNDAIGKLAMLLNVPYKNFQFSGTKDKKATTYQKVGVKVQFEKLYFLALYLADEEPNEEILKYVDKQTNFDFDVEKRNILIFDIRKDNFIKMGEHKGNCFEIRIQDFDASNIFDAKYFLNYFGMQRFGKNVNNHIVGEHIINGEYTKAIDLIYNEPFFSKDGKCKKSKIQRFIENFRNKGKSDKNIFMKMDRDCQMMYLHAYQSYIFNQDVNNLEFDVIDINTVLNLVKKEHKFCKGGERKVFEEIYNLSSEQRGSDTIVRFSLNKSAYATMAIRELTGCEISDYK